MASPEDVGASFHPEAYAQVFEAVSDARNGFRPDTLDRGYANELLRRLVAVAHAYPELDIDAMARHATSTYTQMSKDLQSLGQGDERL